MAGFENFDKGRFTIGQMAKLNGVSIKALNLYHEKGILIPVSIDEASGYRRYSLAQCQVLDFIWQMRAIGFSLAEIKRLLDCGDVDCLSVEIQAKLDDAEAEIRRLHSVKRACEDALNICQIVRNHPECYTVRYETLPERRAIKLGSIEYSAGTTTADEFYSHWELVLRDMRANYVREKDAAFYIKNACDTISKEHLDYALEHGNFEQGVSVYGDALAFIPDGFEVCAEDIRIIPAGQFVVVYTDDIADEDGLYRELDVIQQMLADLDARGYEVAGDYIGEAIVDTPAFRPDRTKMLSRMQIPVRKK